MMRVDACLCVRACVDPDVCSDQPWGCWTGLPHARRLGRMTWGMTRANAAGQGMFGV